jgi:fructose-bisphosphate aldolase class II
MPLVRLKEILVEAKTKKYGVPSLLAGDLEMVIGAIRAAEEQRSPLILAFNQEVTPHIPVELGIPVAVMAARRASVPVATILDHGESLEDVVKAIELGTSSVMFDGSGLPYEENVRYTHEVERVAHAAGVCVEAELGSIAGSAVDIGGSDREPESRFTDPEVAADFVARTGVDALAISFGNAHGVYQGEPKLNLDLVRRIHAVVEVPLVMHGASGLAEDAYPKIVDSGINKVCYYTAMGMGAARDLRQWLGDADQNSLVYHRVISRAIEFFYADTKRLLNLLGCSGVV